MTSPLLKSVFGEGGAQRLPPRGPPGRRGQKKDLDLTPLPWNRFFTESHDIKVGEGNQNAFRVYTCGSPDSSLMVVLLHGGGYCGLTWALFAAELCKRVAVDCLAIDLRGHGDSYSTDDSDLSAATMCQDVGSVVGRHREQKLAKTGVATSGVVLMGHSMGGALAVRVASQGLISDVAGVVVIDVVEGTAIDALGSMHAVLKSRPQSFPTIDAAIAWSVKSGQTRNYDAARVSMPGQVVKASGEPRASSDSSVATASSGLSCQSLGGISEEDEGEASSKQEAQKQQEVEAKVGEASSFVWRINLDETEKFWHGWFENLSQLFLSLTCPRVLILAGMDRLDKDLTVGQMQGKFQLQVIEKVGHAVHEDAPDRLADVMASFLVRNKLASCLGNFQPSFPCC